MSYASELAGLHDLCNSVLSALVPAAAGNVYVPGPEMPDGVYEGTYPYVAVHAGHQVTTELQAGGGPEYGNDDGDPNLYHVDYVDQLVSESGSTLAATYAAQTAFKDGLADAFLARTARCLADGGGNPRVEVAGETVTWDENPRGMVELAAGQPSILTRGTVTVRGLHRFATS